ncbi:MAG: hypothetical protein V3V40_04015, partial [Nitrosomonadaceae bacterium]
TMLPRIRLIPMATMNAVVRLDVDRVSDDTDFVHMARERLEAVSVSLWCKHRALSSCRKSGRSECYRRLTKWCAHHRLALSITLTVLVGACSPA